MNGKQWLAIGLAVVALFGVGAAAFYTGFGPAPGDGSDGSVSEFPTATPSPSDGGGGSASPPFTFTVDDVEECGSTCRDVTVTLTNQQDTAATGVTVYTRIHAGRDNTAEEDVVWENQREVGRLAADGARTTSERVELSFQDGMAIQQNDGWITIVTTVETDERTVTFTDTEQVT